MAELLRLALENDSVILLTSFAESSLLVEPSEPVEASEELSSGSSLMLAALKIWLVVDECSTSYLLRRETYS